MVNVFPVPDAGRLLVASFDLDIVSQRQREIGIRMTLGADRTAITE